MSDKLWTIGVLAVGTAIAVVRSRGEVDDYSQRID
jgi:hypothetical protein